MTSKGLQPETPRAAVEVTFNDKPLHHLNSRPSVLRCLVDEKFFGLSTLPTVDVNQTKSCVSGFYNSTSCIDQLSYKHAGRIISLSPKPILELLKFNDNPTTYLQFMFVFKSTIQIVQSDDKVQLLYLNF